MGQDPEQIREEIERTREEMGETVGAIGYKTDVKSRTRDKVTETKGKITGRAEDLKDRVTGTVSGAGEKASGVTDRLPGGGSEGSSGPGVRERVSSAAPDSEEAKLRARRAKSVAQQNPLGLAVGSAALGFLAGLLIPSTDVENEKIGPIADQLKEEARSTGQEAIERGKQVAQELSSGDAKVAAQEAAKDAARESVQDTVQDQAQGFKESLKESAENVQGAAKSS